MKAKSVIKESQKYRVPVDVLLGRAAMVGFIFIFGSYLTVDVLSPGFI